MVGGDAIFAVDRTALQQFVNGVLLQAGYEENSFFMEQSEPGVTDVALVEDHDGAFGQLHSLGHTAFMSAGIGNGDKSRNTAIMVKDGVHFDAALPLAKRCPGKKRQAQLDGGGIHAEQLCLEPELVFGRMRLTQGEHFAEQILKKAHRPGVVGIGKGGAGQVFQPPVVQATSGGGQTTQSVAHGAPCGKLDESHGDELLLEAELAR